MKIKKVFIMETDQKDKPPKEKAKREPKPPRYCSKCGGIVEDSTKRCTQCGKQYFKLTWQRFALWTSNALILAVFLVVFFTLYNEYQYMSYKYYDDYEKDVQFWQRQYLDADSDSTAYKFVNVEELKSTVSKKANQYTGKRITVLGTLVQIDDTEYCLFDYEDKTLNNSARSAADLYKIRIGISKYPSVRVHFKKNTSVILNDGDYIYLTGIVKFEDGKIYLDDCEYKIIISAEEN